MKLSFRHDEFIPRRFRPFLGIIGTAGAALLVSFAALRAASTYNNCIWVLTSPTRGSGALVAVDPSDGTVMRTVPAGYSPDFAISPDGTRLYVGSTYGNEDALEIADVSSGVVIKRVANPDRQKWGGLAPTSLMVASSDGGHLYMMKRHTTNGKDATWMASFDTKSGAFDSTTVPILDCPGPNLHVRSASRLEIVCGGENTIYAIELDSNGRLGGTSILTLPPPTGTLPNGVVHAKGDIMVSVWGTGDDLFLITFQGRVYRVDTRQMRVIAEGRQPNGGLLFRGEGTISPDGRTLFAGAGNNAWNSDSGTYVAVFDVQTLELKQAIPVKHPFRGMVWNPLQPKLMLAASGDQAIVEFDPVTMSEGRVMSLPATPAVLRSVTLAQ